MDHTRRSIDALWHRDWPRILDGSDAAPADRELAALDGAALALINGVEGWELIAFQQSELIAPGQYRLSRLLRGLAGSQALGASLGATVVFLDASVQTIALGPELIGLERSWTLNSTETLKSFQYRDVGGLPWSVCHLTVSEDVGGGQQATWLPRSPSISDNWEIEETEQARSFVVEFEFGDGTQSQIAVAEPTTPLPIGVVGMAVAERGAEGRLGPWVSLSV